jgi:hypothetical protein
MAKRQGRRGGAGTSGGIDFQARLGAWMATSILAESAAPPLWGWGRASTLESLEAETGEHVDDLRVTNSSRSSAYLQAKLTLSLSALDGSDFASVIWAFVEQYLGGEQEAKVPFGDDDRLVLAVGIGSSGLIRQDLQRLLDRSRSLLGDRKLDSVAGTKSEHKILETFLGRVRAAWRSATSSEPSESDLRKFMSKIWVSAFDLSDGGADTRIAEGHLRSSVLADPGQDGQAWGILVSLVAGLGAIQGGADRPRLQELLTGKGVRLRAAPSYRPDIDRLCAHSSATSQRLRPLSMISLPGDGGEVKLQRSVPGALIAAAAEGSLVVTGDPGVGKSASASELIATLESGGRDVLAFAADALDVGSLGQLRDELGLEHEVVDVLRNWPGPAPGVLVIDGLDAARGEGTQDALLDLIASVSVTAPRWTTVASIRRFDLRYNHKLKTLFPLDPAAPVPAEYVSSEFDTIRHLVVSDLTDDELNQLSELAPALAVFLEAAPADLRDLARVPFNLRLLAELVRLDVDPSELEPITTQVELLDKYWEHRVIGSDQEGDARRAVMSEVVREMVSSRRLQANRRAVVDSHSATALNHLLSEYVLAEQASDGGPIEDEIVTFSHHVLFDYAVDRTMLRGTDGTVTDAILGDPDLLVFARPSFDLHFRHLWELDPERRRFWDASVDLAAVPGMPQIGRVIAPVVAADLIRDVADFVPLLDQLADADNDRRGGAEETLRHLIGAAIGGDSKPYLRDERRLAAWTEFSAALGESELRRPVVFSLRQLVWSLSDEIAALDQPKRESLGCAARRLLAYALDQSESERAFTWPGIAAVAATYETDPVGSRELFGRILRSERLMRFGYVEMPDLAQQVEQLVDHDPDLVREIYAAAFSFEETSKETTEMGGGPVLRLSSNRAQDYSGAHYTLGEAFPTFLEKAPSEAIEALVAIRVAYARKRSTESQAGSISFIWSDGSQARVLSDGTGAWDQEPLGHDDEVKISDAFEARLDALAEQDEVRALAEIIGELARLEIPGAIWRRVLLAAARRPEIFAPLIRPLLVAPEVLSLSGLTTASGEFLAAGFASLEPDFRAEIERAIIALPDHLAEAKPEIAERAFEIGGHLRDRLLGCLTPTDLADPELRARLQELIAGQSVPSNRESGLITEWGSSEYGERDFLAEEGVDVDSKANRRMQALIEPVREFAKEHLNGSPSAEQVNGIQPALQALWNALLTASADGVEERQADQGMGYAAEAAEAIARGKAGEQSGSSLDLAREILMSAAAHREPVHNPESDAHFDEHPSWGSPAPRVEAAAGLVALARDPRYAEPDLFEEIQKLANDSAPAVRFQIARRLGLMEANSPHVMWKIAEAIAGGDPSRAVTDAMLTALPGMTREEPDKRREIAESLYLRTPSEGAGSQHLRSTSAAILVDLDVGSGDEEAAKFLRREVLADLGQNGEVARSLIHRLRRALTFDGDETEASALRGRAISVVDDTLRNAIDVYEVVSRRLDVKQGSSGDDDPDLKNGRSVAQLIDSIGAELYFASGAFKGNDDEPRVSSEQRERLYLEAGAVLDQLATVPLAPVTHHLLQTLEGCIEFDPRGVFLRIAKAIQGGSGGGYQLDTMAANLFVSIVERYLAEYRTLFQRHEDMRRRLIEMLDLFVEAGWPKARQLTYGLHELFR